MKYFLALFLCLLILPASAWAQRIEQTGGDNALINDRIAAVVNDSVISTADISERMKLAILSSGLPSTPEIQQRILPQVLRGLIDEQLQLQEAKRLDISVTKEEVDKALQHIAQDNGVPGDIRDYLRSRGASASALEQQVRAGISWSKVVQRELRPRVEVGDDEVESVIDRLRANAGKEEYLVSEILLTVDNAKDDEQVKQVAENLAQQIKGGANFGAVARQFSQSTGAGSGGDIGWIQEGQLSPELNHTLLSMQIGEVAGPIHSASGYHLIQLREKRTIALTKGDAQDISLDLQQAFRPFDSTARRAVPEAELNNLRASITGCDRLSDRLAQRFPNWHWQNLGTIKQDKLPSWLGDKVRDTPVGKASLPISTDKGTLVVFVCARHMPEIKVDRDAIYTSIGTEKLELQARRLMRDLHRSAYVDLRLGN